MQKLQNVFNTIREKKKQQKDLRAQYRDALVSHDKYQRIKEEIEKLRNQKQEIEHAIQAEMGNDYTKLEALKDDLKTDQELLSDIAISQLMDGNPIYVQDEHDNEYEPTFRVTFKKM